MRGIELLSGYHGQHVSLFMKKIEIWSKEVWETPDNEGKMDSEEFAGALEKYNF